MKTTITRVYIETRNKIKREAKKRGSTSAHVIKELVDGKDKKNGN